MKIYKHLYGDENTPANIPVGYENVFEDAKKDIKKIAKEIKNDEINYLPPALKVFNAFHMTPFNDVRVVIIGQDPYYKPGLANGLAFSCDSGVPPSLNNIYKEVKNCYPDFVIPKHGDLSPWCAQGVLLLNISLTAKSGEAGYRPLLWMSFIDALIAALTNRKGKKKIIWVMWGAQAQKIGKLIAGKGIELKAAHPSPANAHGGFIGCKHFSKINKILRKQEEPEIDWTL